MAATSRPPIELPPATPLERVGSVVSWGFGLVWLLSGTTGLRFLYRRFGGARMEPLTRIYTRGQTACTAARVRSVIHPKVRPDQPYMFFQNHVNLLDPHLTTWMTPHFKQGVELASHFDVPLYGPFVRARGTIPIAFGSIKHLRDLRKSIQSEVAQGHSILLYPEGTRTTTGHIGPFQEGVFRIAQYIGIPIVPVTTTGWYEVMRKGSSMIYTGREVTVYFDEPIEVKDTKRKDLPRIMGAVRGAMERRLDDHWRAQGLLG